MSVRVAVVDDQVLFAETLRAVLDVTPDIEVVAVLERGEDLLDIVRREAVDVALVDVDMPGMTGLETVEALTRIPSVSPVRVIMLTVFTTPGVVRAALDARVAGFMGKNTHARDLVRAIREVADGGRVVPADLASQAAIVGPNPLTATEQRVLRSSRGGVSTARIADDLTVTVGTVKNHLSHAIQKLGASNRAEALDIAERNGWL